MGDADRVHAERADVDGLARPERLVGRENGVLQIGRQIGRRDRLSNRKAASRQVFEIGHLETAQQSRHLLREATDPHEMAVSVGRDGETIRDAYSAARQLTIELAERGVLAPDEPDIVEADIAEPADK